MTPSELRDLIQAATAAMTAAVAAIDELPAGCLDADEDMDILQDLTTFQFALTADLSGYDEACEIYESLASAEAFKK